jgi:hypothetical protein
VLARFGSPGSPLPLLVVDRDLGVDRDTAPPAPERLQRRRDLAAALLANPTVRAPEAAAERLRSGAVDPRLLGVLALVAARQGVELGGLPAAAGDAPGLPARRALVTSVGGRPVGRGRPGTDALLAVLRTQRAPWLPDEITATAAGVLVGYRWVPDPDAVVARAGE